MPLVHVVPLHHPYLLLIPKAFEGYPHLDIYSFDPSNISNRRICTLHLSSESIEPDEHVVWHEIHTGDRPYTSQGHFHADLSRSMVVLQLYIVSSRGERVTHYCIPRTTLLAQIQNAEGASRKAPRADGGTVQPQPQPVLWADWGVQGCLRLSLRGRRTMAMPFGSRLPLLVVDESDGRRAAVYVFDVNPHVARYQNHVLATARERGSTTVHRGRRGLSRISTRSYLGSSTRTARGSRTLHIASSFRMAGRGGGVGI